jgi:large subunit ribosomal protein L21
MYAVIQTGGKQYRVQPEEVIAVERLNAQVGDTVEFDSVLALGDAEMTLGTPTVPGAKVVGTVLANERGRKVRVFKYKPKKHYKRTRGHRQELTRVRIDRIQV